MKVCFIDHEMIVRIIGSDYIFGNRKADKVHLILAISVSNDDDYIIVDNDIFYANEMAPELSVVIGNTEFITDIEVVKYGEERKDIISRNFIDLYLNISKNQVPVGQSIRVWFNIEEEK